MYHYTSTTTTVEIDKTDNTQFGENVKRNFHTRLLGCKLVHPLWKGSGTFLYNPSIALLGIRPQNENILP